MPSLVEIDPEVLEKKMKMWKVYDNDDYNDDGQRTNLTWAFGSGEQKINTPNKYNVSIISEKLSYITVHYLKIKNQCTHKADFFLVLQLGLNIVVNNY